MNTGAGKGDSSRPVNGERYRENFDRIFRGNADRRIHNPGSPEAVKAGCTCPLLDNNHGNGYHGIEGVFVHRAGCPIHDPTNQQTNNDK